MPLHESITATAWSVSYTHLDVYKRQTIISSCITAFLFGGITSSGSTVLVQLLAKTPLGMVGSCFVVQFITDYIDRVLCIAVAAVLITALRKSMKENFAWWKSWLQAQHLGSGKAVQNFSWKKIMEVQKNFQRLAYWPSQRQDTQSYFFGTENH